MNSETYVGVDVSKDSLDVKVLPTNETLQISNDDLGIKALIKQRDIQHICMPYYF